VVTNGSQSHLQTLAARFVTLLCSKTYSFRRVGCFSVMQSESAHSEVVDFFSSVLTVLPMRETPALAWETYDNLEKLYLIASSAREKRQSVSLREILIWYYLFQVFDPSGIIHLSDYNSFLLWHYFSWFKNLLIFPI
jgi:hypothetical protein